MKHAYLSSVLLLAMAPQAAAGLTLTVTPAEAQLSGQNARQRLIVMGQVDGRQVDLTRRVVFQSQTPDVVQVDAAGVARGVGDGLGVVSAAFNGQTARATFHVSHAKTLPPANLELDIIPILTAAGCNAGACHGKARGQNGFQLSLLGFYPDFDYAALTMEARGRRVFPAAPRRSLLLRKASAQIPHGGGKRLEPGGPRYETLLRWIATGMRRKGAGDPAVERISVFPTSRSMVNGDQQQLLVTAHYSNGATRDVTGDAAFQSSESVYVGVDDAGLITAGDLPGEATVMARYLGHIATCNVTIPLPGDMPEAVYAKLPRNNFVDELVWKKLQTLGVTPSAAASDGTFLRRAYTDVIGRLPTPEEAREFLNDPSADKRERLIDYLLEQPEFAEFWANKWSDLLLPNPYRVGIKTVLNYDAWIRDSFRQNKPYDQFVRELLTAQGGTWSNGAVTLFRDRRTPEELTTIVSQLFLGVRLECAKCHHHRIREVGAGALLRLRGLLRADWPQGPRLVAADLRQRRVRLRRDQRRRQTPQHRRDSGALAAVWQGAADRSRRRPPRGAGRLDYVG